MSFNKSGETEVKVRVAASNVMGKEEENLILKYAMYTILYSNDLACNCIKEVSPFIEGKDKESKKIYKALMRRVVDYQRLIRSIIHEGGNNFLAEYNSYMDDVNDQEVEDYRYALRVAYRDAGITEYDFIGYLETARSMFYLSINVIEALIMRLSKDGIKSYNLKNYSLKSFAYIMDNLINWCCRNVEKEVDDTFDITKNEAVMKSFANINENILNFDSFYTCYNNALNNFEGNAELYR